ncbi:MAG: adenine phosphoribosyltransferase [Actinomycetota bacterium]|nr:adenine phosphoribosyltransferase [Actinomycetota bacterium]
MFVSRLVPALTVDGVVHLKDLIRDIPDFPNPGIVFKDITPLLADADAFRCMADALVGHFADRPVDKVVGIEARGFILAAPIAYLMGAGFVPVRKAGKLPWRTRVEEYSLEYGTDRLEMHQDGVEEGDNVLVVDDVLATGGTAAATLRLVEAAGGRVVGLGFVIELAFLGGRSRLAEHESVALLTYE